MPLHVYANDLMRKPPVATLDLIGLPNDLLQPDTDLGSGFLGLLDALGVNHNPAPDIAGRLVVSGSPAEGRARLWSGKDGLAETIALQSDQAPGRHYSTSSIIRGILEEAIGNTIVRMPNHRSLAHVIGTVASPFAQAAQPDRVDLHINEPAFWRIGDGRVITTRPPVSVADIRNREQ